MKSSHFSILSRVINGSSMEITRSKENLVFIHNELLIIEGRIRHRLLIGLYEDLAVESDLPMASCSLIWIDSLSFEDGVEKKVRAPHLLKEMKFSLGIVHAVLINIGAEASQILFGMPPLLLPLAMEMGAINQTLVGIDLLPNTGRSCTSFDPA
ncbi:hypothetical protein ACJX0J_037314 [Zea mays]